MGARISIQFEKKDEKSVVLFSHWGGEEFKKGAEDFVEELKQEIATTKNAVSYPLTRLEPQTVMVEFVRYITRGMERVESDLYLGVDSDDGDNSDYGHHVISLD